jgi:hypothetical protein
MLECHTALRLTNAGSNLLFKTLVGVFVHVIGLGFPEHVGCIFVVIYFLENFRIPDFSVDSHAQVLGPELSLFVLALSVEDVVFLVSIAFDEICEQGLELKSYLLKTAVFDF